MLPTTSDFVKSYGEPTIWMYFLIEDNDLLEKISADIKIEFDSKPVYNKKLKTKIKSYGGEVTDFYDKKHF